MVVTSGEVQLEVKFRFVTTRAEPHPLIVAQEYLIPFDLHIPVGRELPVSWSRPILG